MDKPNASYYNRLVEPLHPLSIGVKFLALVIVAMANSSTPMQPSWAITMVLFAALFIVPIAIQLIGKSQNSFFLSSDVLVWHLPCTFLLAASFVMSRSPLAGVFALPYATWCMEIFLRGLKIEIKRDYLIRLAVFAFLANGSVWLLFDRFGMQPLGFSTWVVILTGVHFHFAGFMLLAALSLFLNDQTVHYLVVNTCYFIILGVILTAAGITTTQMGYGHDLEMCAGVWMSIAAAVAGSIFVRFSVANDGSVNYFWLLGGICLVFSMFLASLYALRSVIVLDWLSLPFMQAVHGTVNSLGFGTLVLLGWAFQKQNQNS